jgi:hypothetical protein
MIFSPPPLVWWGSHISQSTAFIITEYEKQPFWTKRAGLVVTLWTFNWICSVSILVCTRYHDWDFWSFSSVLPSKCRDSILIKSWLLLSRAFSVLYSWALQFDPVWYRYSNFTGIVTDFGLDNWGVGVQVLIGDRTVSVCIIQTGSGAHPASYPIGAWGSFHGVQQSDREADYSPHLQLVFRSRKRGPIQPLLYTPS